MLFDFYLLFYILPLKVSSLEMIPFNTTHFRLSWDEAILRNGVTPRSIILFEKTEERDVEIGMIKFNGRTKLYKHGKLMNFGLCIISG